MNRIAALRTAGDQIAVGDLARTECLVQPFFTGNAAVIADYQAFFSDPEVTVLPMSSTVCERAAHTRAGSRNTLEVLD